MANDSKSEEIYATESVQPTDKERIDGEIVPGVRRLSIARILDTLTHQTSRDDTDIKYIDIDADYLHKKILDQEFRVPVYPLLLTFSGLPDSGKTTALGKLLELRGNELDKVHFTHHELVASDFKSSKVRYAAVACDAGYTFAMQCGLQYNLFVHELGKPQYLDTRSQAFIDPVLTQHVDMVVHHLKQRDETKQLNNPQDRRIISLERSLTTGVGLINVWDNIAVQRKVAPFLQCFSGHYSKNYVWLFINLDRDLSKLHLPPQLKGDDRFGMKWRSRVQYLLRSCRLCEGNRKRVCTIFAIHETMENLADRLYRLKLECKNAAKQMGVHELVDFDIVAVDVASKEEQAILRKRMMKLLHDVESQEVPLSWIFLRGSFALHHSTYITRKELQAKANECGIKEENLKHFCEFFTSFGSILDVQLIDLNSEYVIIKPVEFLAKLDSFFKEMENHYGIVSSEKSSDFLKILSSVGLAAEIVNPPIVLDVALPKCNSSYYYIPSVRTGDRNVTCSPGAIQLVIGMQSSVMNLDVAICHHLLRRLQNAELILSDMMNAITIKTTLSGGTPFKFDMIFQGDVIEIVSHEEYINEDIDMTEICQEICTVCESMAEKTINQPGEMKYHFAVTCAEDEHHEISYNIHHRRHVLPFNYDQCSVCLQNGRNTGQITTWNDYLYKNLVEEKFKLNGELSAEDVSMLAVEIGQYPWDAIAIFAKELNSPISDDHQSKKRKWWFIFQMIMEWEQNQKNESVKKELAMKLISAHDEWKVNEKDVTKKVVRFKRLARKLDIQAFTKNQLSNADYIPGATKGLES